MQITDVKLFLVNRGVRYHWGNGNSANWAFVKVYTDEGIEGVGEAFHSLDEPIQGALTKFRRWLVGKDPTRILYNWQSLYRGLRYPPGTATLAALSALEHAMWDIAGKACGLPVYKMLGGPVRDYVRVYANPNSFKDPETESQLPPGFSGSVEGLVRRAQRLLNAGFTAMKFAPQPDDYMTKSAQQVFRESVERVRAVREAVGDNIDIALDYHGRSFSPIDAIRLAQAIEPYHILFLEEPALSENPNSLVETKMKTTIPIAAGERAVTRDLMRSLIEKQAVHIIQPEPTANGGIMETVRMAAMAELYSIVVAPHMAAGVVDLVVCGHIDMVMPNFLIQEYNDTVRLDSQVIQDIFTNLPRVEQGRLILPDGPGLGIELNDEAAASYPPLPYDRPMFVAPDGSVALE